MSASRAPEPAPVAAAARRRVPGERLFALVMLGLAGFVLVEAHGIAGFTALGSPGALPLAAGGVMLVSAIVVAVRALPVGRIARAELSSLLPLRLVGFVGLVGLFAALLDRLGFLLAGTGFLIASMLWLHRRQPLRVVAWSLLAVLLVYVLFRLVFEVLLPEGIVPERAILAWLGDRLAELVRAR